MAATREPRRALVSRLRVSQWFLIAAVALVLVTVVSAVVGGVALVHAQHERGLVVDELGPARTASFQLESALLEQETAVRGFALTGDEGALAPYTRGIREEAEAVAALRRYTREHEATAARPELGEILGHVGTWRNTYATPTIAAVRRGGVNAHMSVSDDAGRRLFDEIRAPLVRQQQLLQQERVAGRDRLDSASRELMDAFIAILVLLVIGIAGVLVALRATVSRPLRFVGGQVRRTAQGAYTEPIAGAGALDVVQLAEDVDTMRQRILQELDGLRVAHGRLDAQTRELQRSNAELEQFAYVASHDLQEPLRKVASFCQLIEQRYAGQLDERGEQYIAFAVDGAKRMQQLINDLLAFSRAGRGSGEPVVVELDDVVRDALGSLATAIEETGAEVVVPSSPLPRVRGEASLLAGVVQNLVGNALKFHGEQPPHVELAVVRDGDMWELSVTDNGIGIEPEYAERIFAIFQRLHAKNVYPGTGIGLAMCRKTIEHHGGRIWLDTESSAGTTFRFTLPVLDEERT